MKDTTQKVLSPFPRKRTGGIRSILIGGSSALLICAFLLSPALSHNSPAAPDGLPIEPSLPVLSHPSAAPMPQIDPFYLRLYESGEKAFSEKRYDQAAHDLQIAVFGLAKDKLLAGKTYLLLSLSYHYLADRGKSKESLSRAARVLSGEDFETLNLGDEVLAPLRKLAADYRVNLGFPSPTPRNPSEKEVAVKPPVKDPPPEKEAEAEPPTAPPPVKKKTAPPAKQVAVKPPETTPPLPKKDPEAVTGKPAEKTPPEAGERGWAAPPDIKEIERRLKSDPGNAGIVHELTSLYFARKEYKEAKRMLSRFLTRHPSESTAVFNLAKTNFFLQDYRAAMNGFNHLSSPAAEAGLESDTKFKISIYKVLCLFSMGQESSAPPFFNYVISNVPAMELARLLEEEGLTSRWENVVSEIKR